MWGKKLEILSCVHVQIVIYKYKTICIFPANHTSCYLSKAEEHELFSDAHSASGLRRWLVTLFLNQKLIRIVTIPEFNIFLKHLPAFALVQPFRQGTSGSQIILFDIIVAGDLHGFKLWNLNSLPVTNSRNYYYLLFLLINENLPNRKVASQVRQHVFVLNWILHVNSVAANYYVFVLSRNELFSK